MMGQARFEAQQDNPVPVIIPRLQHSRPGVLEKNENLMDAELFEPF